jgi:hypothetical protein
MMNPHFDKYVAIMGQYADQFGLKDITPPSSLIDPDRTTQPGGLMKKIKVWEGDNGRITIESRLSQGLEWLFVNYEPHQGKGSKMNFMSNGEEMKVAYMEGMAQGLSPEMVAQGFPRMASMPRKS